MPSRRNSTRIWGLILAPAALLALAVTATGQDEAPRRPPEPFRVFVHATPTADAAVQATLDDALPMVRERVTRRNQWFRLADSAETAEVTLRITHYRQANLNLSVRGGQTEAMLTCWATGYHYVDAVALAGDARAALSGLDHRCIDEGPSLRSAAGHLAEELERFAKDNYGALSRVKARAKEKRARGETPG
ncbi:MAG: hypothetical protein F4Y71_07360 [Acidobacteria bacterium]|nr:hypothetical protein [Acidobacteriota bacterium]MYG76529.1 hypothetical protein [Acidobacteriota bacterium]